MSLKPRHSPLKNYCLIQLYYIYLYIQGGNRTKKNTGDMKHAYIVIMAGGIGSRFWPASTSETPKQFLDIAGQGKSLLRMTYERFRPIVPAERIMVLTHADYTRRVLDELPEVPARNILEEQ